YSRRARDEHHGRNGSVALDEPRLDGSLETRGADLHHRLPAVLGDPHPDQRRVSRLHRSGPAVDDAEADARGGVADAGADVGAQAALVEDADAADGAAPGADAEADERGLHRGGRVARRQRAGTPATGSAGGEAG